MSKQVISAPNAPAAIGPYSQAVASGGFLFCSGQIPLDPQTGDVVAGDVAAQAGQVLRNVDAVLSAAGCGRGDVVKVTMFLRDMADFAAVNAVYSGFFSAPFPARSTIAVAGLPRDVRVEIEIVARLPQ